MADKTLRGGRGADLYPDSPHGPPAGAAAAKQSGPRRFDGRLDLHRVNPGWS
jgi:hypothetical protein